MSKTRGNVLDPFAVIEEYGADPLRYYLMREVTLGQDGDVSIEGLRARYNSELANELGNLVSRSVSMIGKYREGAIPAEPADEVVQEVAAEGEAMIRVASARYEAVEVTAALGRDLGVRAAPQPSGRGRGALEARQGRGPGGAPRRGAARPGGRPASRGAGHPPRRPGTAEEILRRLGQAHGTADLLLDKAVWAGLAPATVVAGPPLFPRLEADA